MYKTLHKKQGSVTVQLRFARSSVTFCAKRDTYRCYWEENKKNIFITDDVGLGKTIEVGIIIKEKLEREYDNSAKILIIVPKFLCIQWKEQLQKLFHISAKIAENGELDRGCYQGKRLNFSR